MEGQTIAGMSDALREVLLAIMQNQSITFSQINLISRYLNIIALEGDDEHKKIVSRYLLITRTNLPYNSDVRATLADFERAFRARCAPLLNKLSAFMPRSYLQEIGQENQEPVKRLRIN